MAAGSGHDFARSLGGGLAFLHAAPVGSNPPQSPPSGGDALAMIASVRPHEMQTSMRKCRDALAEKARENRAKVYVNEGGRNARLVVQEIDRLFLRDLAALAELPHVRDIVIWNMKQSEHHEALAAAAQRPSGKELRLQPIVAEVTFDSEPSADEDAPASDRGALARYLDAFTQTLRDKGEAVRDRGKELLEGHLKAMKNVPAPLLDATLTVVGAVGTELDSGDVHFPIDCDSVRYKSGDHGGKRFHCFVLQNPPAVSALKLVALQRVYVAYLESCKFTSVFTPQTTCVGEVTLALVFAEKLPGGGKSAAPVPPPSSSPTLAQRSKQDEERYAPY